MGPRGKAETWPPSLSSAAISVLRPVHTLSHSSFFHAPIPPIYNNFRSANPLRGPPRVSYKYDRTITPATPHYSLATICRTSRKGCLTVALRYASNPCVFCTLWSCIIALAGSTQRPSSHNHCDCDNLRLAFSYKSPECLSNTVWNVRPLAPASLVPLMLVLARQQ